jgi:hypothetical protein
MTTIPDVPTNPSPRAEAARQMIPQIRAIVESLDSFVHLSPGERLRLNTAANVPNRFLEAVAGNIETSDRLAANARLAPATVRETVVYSQAMLSLADEMDKLTRGVRDTVKAVRAGVATEALRVFGVAQKMNRRGDREELIPSLEQMSRALNRGRKKPGAKAPEPPAAATPSITQ